MRARLSMFRALKHTVISKCTLKPRLQTLPSTTAVSVSRLTNSTIPALAFIIASGYRTNHDALAHIAPCVNKTTTNWSGSLFDILRHSRQRHRMTSSSSRDRSVPIAHDNASASAKDTTTIDDLQHFDRSSLVHLFSVFPFAWNCLVSHSSESLVHIQR